MTSTKRMREPFAPVLTLPPPFTLVTLRELGDAHQHAVSIAAEQGAGTMVYVGRFDLAEFAVVLGPDEPLLTARRAIYAGMTALTDALLAYSPPEKMVTVDWPDAIRVDGGLVGGGRLSWPQDAREVEPPAWLVFSAMIRTVSMSEQEPGLHPLASALEQEGFDDIGAAQIAESFARHLMVAMDTWEVDGFADVAKEYVRRLPRESGVIRQLDDNGDLLTRSVARADVARRKLLPALTRPSWLDPKTGGPRL